MKYFRTDNAQVDLRYLVE